jgi:hypothetical protein
MLRPRKARKCGHVSQKQLGKGICTEIFDVIGVQFQAVSLGSVLYDLNYEPREAIDKQSPRTTLASQKVVEKSSVDVGQWHGERSIRVVAASAFNCAMLETRKFRFRLVTPETSKHHSKTCFNDA